MKFYVRIDEAGGHGPHLPVTDDAVPLLFSLAAAEFIRDLLVEKNCYCKHCSLFVRSDELADGRCKEGTGCSVDPVAGEIYTLPEPLRTLVVQGRLYQYMAALHVHLNVVHGQPVEVETETEPEQGPDESRYGDVC